MEEAGQVEMVEVVEEEVDNNKCGNMLEHSEPHNHHHKDVELGFFVLALQDQRHMHPYITCRVLNIKYRSECIWPTNKNYL